MTSTPKEAGISGGAGIGGGIVADLGTGGGLDATRRVVGAAARLTGLDRAAQAAGDVLRGLFCGKLPWQFGSGRELAECVSGGASEAAQNGAAAVLPHAVDALAVIL